MTKQAKKENFWKTSDIKISKDCAGYYDAEHEWAGVLFEGSIFDSRAEARREAVIVLKEMKNDQEDY